MYITENWKYRLTKLTMNAIEILVFLTTLLIQFKWISSQPADLGAFGANNDATTGFVSYSFPSEIDRIPSELFVMAKLNYTYVNDRITRSYVYPKEVAKYGEGQIRDVSAPLIHITNRFNVSDHTACSVDIRGTNGNDLPSNGTLWIALIKRGVCKFEDKVQHVYNYNAVGAIIYNNVDSENLDKMKIEDKSRK